MCEPMSLVSAGLSIGGGMLGAADAKSRASFEAAQLDSMRILSQARASDQQSELMNEMSDLVNAQIGAMAVSGLAAASFESITADTRAQGIKAGQRIHRNSQDEQRQLATQAAVTLSDGRLRARSLMLSGFKEAFGTIYDADYQYRQAKTPLRDASGAIVRNEAGEVQVESRVQAIGSFFRS